MIYILHQNEMMIRNPQDEVDLGLFNANVLERLGLS